MWKFVYLGYTADYYVYNIQAYKRSYEEVYRVAGFRYRPWSLTKLIWKLHRKAFVQKIFPGFGNERLLREMLDKKTQQILKPTDKICFFVLMSARDRYIFDELPQFLHKQYPFCKVVLDFDDKVDLYLQHPDEELAEFKKNYDLVISYNKFDVEKYNLYPRPPLMTDYSDISFNRYGSCDIFFVGKDKGRLQQIVAIFEECQALGLQCDFYITDVTKEKRQYEGLIHYIDRMPYGEILARDRCARCILNLVQDGAEGVTLRDFEAVGMNKLLMTNGQSVKAYGFYSPDMVIALGDIAKKADIIKQYADTDSSWQAYKEYSPQKFYESLGKFLEEI